MKSCLSAFKVVLLSVFLLVLLTDGHAQFDKIEIGVNGLTCSQCSRSVEMSLLKLDFVKEVEMNLENANGKIVLKNKNKIDLKKISSAVTDAGFSMRYLKVSYLFSDETSFNGSIPVDSDLEYCVINGKGKVLNGEIQLLAIGKDFMPRQEYNRWKASIAKSCGEIIKDAVYLAL